MAFAAQFFNKLKEDQASIPFQKVLLLSNEFKITDQKLEEYEKEYFYQISAKRIELTPLEWTEVEAPLYADVITFAKKAEPHFKKDL
mmetsp:Transcript_12108/g.11965  ORF Transcript_12108/g.11965 Transcript_12108/m.11965 type:complete len:87 (-) Transcript_12108:70-330(-)